MSEYVDFVPSRYIEVFALSKSFASLLNYIVSLLKNLLTYIQK